MYTIDKSTSQQINAMKFVFILLVVFIHSEALPQLPYELDIPIYVENCKQIISVFTDVAIPGFAFFSGFFLFSREFTWCENMRKKIRSILVPYLIINSFWIAFFILVQKIPMLAGYFTAPEYKIDSLDDIINAYIGQVPLYYPFWFLKDLFILNILASVFQKILNKFPLIIVGGLLLLQFSDISVSLIYNKQVLIWFLFGGIWVRYRLDILIIKKIPSLLLAFMTFMVTLAKMIWTDNVFVATFSLAIMFCFFYILADKLLHSKIYKAVIWGGGNLVFLCMHPMNIMRQCLRR